MRNFDFIAVAAERDEFSIDRLIIFCGCVNARIAISINSAHSTETAFKTLFRVENYHINVYADIYFAVKPEHDCTILECAKDMSDWKATSEGKKKNEKKEEEC